MEAISNQYCVKIRSQAYHGRELRFELCFNLSFLMCLMCELIIETELGE